MGKKTNFEVKEMAQKGDMMNSTIGDGSSFEGKFYISGSLRIDGKFEGEIKTDDELVVGESGRVKTDIVAKSVVIAGTVIGNINAFNEVRLLETAKVLGDITAPVINIMKGVVLMGNVIVTGGQKVDPKKIVENAYNLTNKLPDQR